MNSTSEAVVIEDDDDDVEFIGVTCGAQDNNSSPAGEGSASDNVHGYSGPTPGSVLQKLGNARSKKSLPLEIQGHTKPTYNYSRLITQALAIIPERRATALQICDMIAQKYPYYKLVSQLYNWQGSIYTALRTRKKFFSIVGIDEKKEFIWSFNSNFEQFMLDKWVPKYVQKKGLASIVPWLPKSHPQQVNRQTSSECSVVASPANTSPLTVSSGSPTPVIVFSGSLVSCSPGASNLVACDNSFGDPVTSESSDKDPLEPEISHLEPQKTQSDSSVEQEFNPWEPEVTVKEHIPDYTSQQAPNIVATAFIKGGMLTGAKAAVSTKKPSGNEDFSLDNLHIRHVILKEEIFYRVNFNKEHKSVEKFRLHCTVCDDHLGTSGAACHRKVRLHSSLGVLVCVRCYKTTLDPPSTSCLWCAKMDDGKISCNLCESRFCKTCIERNFGQAWCGTIMSRRDWKCFRCDTKQIWPHRAIAYFLFRHYREIRRRKDELTKNITRSPREIRFFIQDLSTCCKSVGSRETQLAASTVTVPSTLMSAVPPPVATNPTLTTSAAPTITSVSSQQPLFVIGEQSPSYIYVQSPSSVPSVTLNTGTQYIHNVYPVENRPIPPVNTSTMTNTSLYTQPPNTAPSLPFMIHQQPTERNQNLSAVPENRAPPPYCFPDHPPPPYSAVDVEATPVQDSTNETLKKPVSNTSIEANGDIIASKSEGGNNINIIVNLSSELHGGDDPIIIPDADPQEVLEIQEEKVTAVPILSDRERIERRPMPKSKKQSLLRTVLMNESFESMKRHLQLQPEPHTSTDKNEVSVSPTVRKESRQNIEEPILKSIIETATERLLSLQRNQNVSASTSNINEETTLTTVGTVDSTSDTCIDLCDNENSSTGLECQIVDPPITIPKIKIKTLKELQDPEVFNINHNSPENLSQTNEKEDVNKETDSIDEQYANENLEPNKKDLVEEDEVNITDLKQGIIEASRTLINTQKKFKELAKIISSNLTYKPDQAVDLITQFHDILKICHQELDQIDSNVKHKFEHLIPSTDITSLLQSRIKSKEAANPNESPDVLKKCKSKYGKRKLQSAIPQENMDHYLDGNTDNPELNQTDNLEAVETYVQSPIKRKRDLLDFNPLGKKVILGSPEITEEDLRQIPNTWDSSSQERLNQNTNFPCHNQVYMEELRRRQYLARKGAWKKKNIWLTSKRKKRKYTKHSLQYNKTGPLMYRDDGSLVKRRIGRPKKQIYDSDEDEDKTYKPTNSQHYAIRPRRKLSELSRPTRLSARMHPSTVAHVAQLMSSEQTDLTHLMKPCSVVLERLDPKMVRLLERSFVDLSDIEEIY